MGCPLYKGRPRSSLFATVLDKLQIKLEGWKGKLLSSGAKLILIKSILMSMPSYLISLIVPNKETIKMMNKIMSDFLWHNNKGDHRLHWASWKKICMPTEDGGQGIRHIDDISNTSVLKLWWRFRNQNLLWAKYMIAKYYRNCHPIEATISASSSRVWKNMLHYKDKAEEYMHWTLGNDLISVHKDCWLINIINGPSNVQVKDLFYDNGLPNIELIRAECGEEAVREIQKNNIHLQGGKEKLVWTLTPSGNFSFHSAWNMIRSKGTTV